MPSHDNLIESFPTTSFSTTSFSMESLLSEQVGSSMDFLNYEEGALRINMEGDWYYHGTLLERKGLVRLFYTVLTKEHGEYFLTTPVERVKIAVDDAPFAVIAVERDTINNIVLTLNDDSRILVDDEHTLFWSGQGILYVHVRENLDARFTLRCYLQLAEYFEHNEHGEFFIKSGGKQFVFQMHHDM